MITNSKSEAYAAAGVDITAGYRAVELMKKHIARTETPGVVGGLGGFGGLFQLDLWIFGVTGFLLILLLLIAVKIRPARIRSRGPSFWAGTGVLAAFIIIGGLGATDFDRAFTVFHHIFFPGKTNWLFDPMEDQIIQILPEIYFRNCAILAIGLILAFCIIYILIGKKKS